ncbi:TetR/AcrR family transcriptional regulator [Methylobacterium sp. E-025]|uniref:TetR/AcrR family transcriptional regulator n=1 Tax=Methylobacterium sp. E-025 TaxID=2836561 RepID=UPI001FBB283C|nr:TetR/AcrR family transcriptional regulator [Methylobacterium sp. E-025]MCJ2109902.1 TetR/AcrR family transcriptional regulator [Methylobacterium sp. E-025]
MTSEVPQDPIDVEAGTDAAARASITVGRKRDASRDAAILDAAISILAEVGYDGMTMDMVAVRAKAGKATVYRRWATKADMVLEAVARMKREQVDLDNLPDTGNLRDDLLALFRPQPMEETERKLRAMAGMAALLTQHPALADTAHDALVAPWVEANRALMRRALDRGEIPRDADVEMVAQVMPSMGAYRALVRRRPFDRAFLVTMIDGLVLPALGLPRKSPDPTPTTGAPT